MLDAAAAAGSITDPAARAAAVEALWSSLRPGQAESRVPYVTADSAVFLWRGSAASVAVAGDHTGWNPNAALTRQGASDLWLRLDTFDPAARIDYKIVVGGSNWILDPANPHRQASGFGPNSELRMPGWEPDPLTVRNPAVPRGTLGPATVLTSPTYTTAPVTYRVWTPAGYATSTARLPTVYVTDGQEYADDVLGAMTIVLDNLVAQGRIEPVVAVFVDPRQGGTNRREEQYVMNPAFASFVATELVPAVDAAYRTRTDGASRGILGTSLGGLFSAYLGATHPDAFGLLGIHSPAFWIRDPAIFDLVGQTAPGAFRVAMTTGTIHDTADEARRMRDVFLDRSDALTYVEVPEGHSWGNWRGHLDDVLEALFPPRATPTETGAVTPRLRLDAVPNPALASGAALRVTLEAPARARVTCVDTTGRSVFERNAEMAAGTHRIALGAHLAAGVYACRLTAGAETTTRTLTVVS